MLIYTENFDTRGIINRYNVMVAYQSMHWSENCHVAFWPNLYGLTHNFEIATVYHTQKNNKPYVCFMHDTKFGLLTIPIRKIFRWIKYVQQSSKMIISVIRLYELNKTYENRELVRMLLASKISGVEFEELW